MNRRACKTVVTRRFRSITCLWLSSLAPFFVLARQAESQATGQLKSTPELQKKSVYARIPFAKLKSDADFQIDAGATWILLTDAVFVPDTRKKALARIDPDANKVGELITGVDRPCAGAVQAFSSIWVPDCDNGTVVRLQAKSGKLEATLPIGVAKVQVAVTSTADSIWVLIDEKTDLVRIDPDANRVVAELRLPSGCNTLSFAEEALWATCPNEDLVLRIDPETNVVRERIRAPGEPWAIAAGEDAVWVLARRGGAVYRIDPKTNKITRTIDLGIPNTTGNIAAGYGSVWIGSPGFPVIRIDPQQEKVVQQFFGDGGGTIQVGLGSLWLINSQQHMLSRMDPKRILAAAVD